MLETLFGNKSIEKVLISLLVNERCYASQLSRMLALPLTPIQKALERLERGGIVSSHYEGKTKIYCFNAAYPFFQELEVLLKKAYTQLPSHEKKRYYDVSSISSKKGKQEQELLESIWESLHKIRQLSFASKTQGKGKGEVSVVDQNGALLFYEEGHWKNAQGDEFHFSNIFRWILNRFEGLLSLEHLRFGMQNPVFLFHLRPSNSNLLESVDSHLCGQDTYFGRLIYEELFLKLHWRILGPKKNEEMIYIYT